MRAFRYGIATLLVLPLLAILLLLLFLKTPLSDSFVESRLRQWVHPELQINAGVQIDVLGGLQVQAQDIVIPAATGGTLLVTIDQLNWRMGWLPLLSGRVHIDDMGLTGVRVFDPVDGWQVQRDVWEARDIRLPRLLLEATQDRDGLQSVTRELRVDRLLVKGFALMPEGSQPKVAPLLTVEQASFAWLPSQNDETPASISIVADQLVVRTDVEPRSMGAFLEQLGLPLDEPFVTPSLQASLELKSDLANIRSMTARGSWGQLMAQQGTVTLPQGQLNIPFQADLANGVNWRSRGGIQIRTRQARLNFVLTGTVANMGVTWQR